MKPYEEGFLDVIPQLEYNIIIDMATNPAVLVVGAGELGQAIGTLLTAKGITPKFFDSDPARVPGQSPLPEAVKGVEFVFFCVPSWAMRGAVSAALPSLPPSAIVVSFAKGLEKDSMKTMPELLDEILPPGQPHAVIDGPMLAEEIEMGKKAVGVIASRNADASAKLHELFTTPNLILEISDNPFGISLAGVLKNVYAVALGVADGLKLSGNEKGWLAARALGEMAMIGTSFGVQAETMIGTAGAGDLLATGYSEYSRNREVGIAIAKTGSCNERCEGLVSLPTLMQRLGGNSQSYPLLNLVKEIGIDCKPANQTFEKYVQENP